MRVFITGATGMIGSSVLQTHLRVAECTEIIVLKRRTTSVDDSKEVLENQDILPLS